ncbi:MAG TPA: NTP transferase domain-containing protein [Anaeromyxobacter sp.]|nr:NTP transferase domain-containing protein [Anaeromyxobacter sp.]
MNGEDLVRGLGGIVLAAGGPRRPGPPRQLLELSGEPLVRRAARAAVEAGLWPAVVVVGEHAEEVRAALAGLPIVTVAAGEGGPAGAVLPGLRRLLECAPAALGVVILAADQPVVQARHIRALAAAGCGASAPAASSYGGSVGLPALFPLALFPELGALPSERDFSEVLARHAAAVTRVPLEGGELDVDCADDWLRAQALLRSAK